MARWSKDPEVAIAFPLTGTTPSCAAVSTTLPLTSLPGLKTPLNAPFQLTANRDLEEETGIPRGSVKQMLHNLAIQVLGAG